jgi:hypothetical protein
MAAVANVPVENDEPIRIVVPSEHRERGISLSFWAANLAKDIRPERRTEARDLSSAFAD